jgi:hypothetical protein
MITSKILVLFSVPVLVAGAGCAGEIPSSSDSMEILSEGAGTVEARLAVDDEMITITSSTADGVRDIKVASTSGSSYAEWTVKLSNMDTHGTYGEQRFGTRDDITTDNDVALWTQIASSHVGEVLTAVSSAAQELIDAGEHEVVADELQSISRMGPSLRARAHLIDETETDQGYECNYWYGSYGISVCRDDEASHTFAWTSEPAGHCTRTYYTEVYDQDWNFVAGNACPGCSSNVWLHTPYCACHFGRHWDSVYPGSDTWTIDCL